MHVYLHAHLCPNTLRLVQPTFVVALNIVVDIIIIIITLWYISPEC